MIVAQQILGAAGAVLSMGVFGAAILAVWLNDHTVVTDRATVRSPRRRPF